jgi:hypothetical protein
MDRSDVLTGAGYRSLPRFANCKASPVTDPRCDIKDVRLICELAEPVER